PRPPRPPRATLFPCTTLFRSRAGIAPPEVEDGAGTVQGLYLDAETQRLQVAAHDDHAPAEYADRNPDPQPWHAPAIRIRPCRALDRKSTRLNSSHVKIPYAVF